MSECFEKARELGELIKKSCAGDREAEDGLRSKTEQVVAIIRATVYGTLEFHEGGCGACGGRKNCDA